MTPAPCESEWRVGLATVCPRTHREPEYPRYREPNCYIALYQQHMIARHIIIRTFSIIMRPFSILLRPYLRDLRENGKR